MFPPKGEMTLERAREVAGSFSQLNPDFISVTYSAGGSGNNGATTKIAQMIDADFGIPSVAHLTCISLKRADLLAKIDETARPRASKTSHCVATRSAGSPTARAARTTATPKRSFPLGRRRLLRGAAAYPEGHIECDDLELSVRQLKEKQDAGASFLVTQLFFDNQYFYRFRELAERTGITVPITAGIMPFMGKQQISRMVFMCGASLPSPVIKLLARYEDDADSLRAAGIEYACRQLEDLAANGVDGLHVYTMNRADVASAAMSALRA